MSFMEWKCVKLVIKVLQVFVSVSTINEEKKNGVIIYFDSEKCDFKKVKRLFESKELNELLFCQNDEKK